MDEQLKELFRKAFDEGAMYEATLSNQYSFDSFIKKNIEQLRIYAVSCSRRVSNKQIIEQANKSADKKKFDKIFEEYEYYEGYKNGCYWMRKQYEK